MEKSIVGITLLILLCSCSTKESEICTTNKYKVDSITTRYVHHGMYKININVLTNTGILTVKTELKEFKPVDSVVVEKCVTKVTDIFSTHSFQKTYNLKNE